MANLNKVFLIGRLTRDPALKYTPAGAALCEFGLATNRVWTDKQGQKQESVCFVNLVAWGKSGETIHKYVSKGDPIFIDGRLDFSTWTDQSGAKRSALKVVVEGFQFLGKSGGAATNPADAAGDWPPADKDIPF